MKKVTILGISAYYHDSAAAIICDGRIIAAAQEERFTRIKGDASFPHYAIDFCLSEGKISIEDVDYIVFYENPLAKFDRLLISQHITAPKSITSFLAAMPKWLTQNLWLEKAIVKELGLKNATVLFCDHHVSHAASAFYPSPFKEAAVLTVDGVGEWSTTTYGICKDNKVELLEHMTFPNSLGLLYSAFTFYTGFKINSGEYKMMGLAPYGNPIYVDTIKKHCIRIQDDGSFIVNQRYFNYTFGLKTINRRFEALFGQKARKAESAITQFDMDIAASIQAVTSEILLKLAIHVRKTTGMRNLVLAGGVALNVVSMADIRERAGFEQIWVQPASGDAGGALGAALHIWHSFLGKSRAANPADSMEGSFLGLEILPKQKADDVQLKALGGVWTVLEEQELARQIGKLIAQEKIVGIARGAAEWGPRALGNRSILGNAQSTHTQYRMNMKIKFRESFRPFAPIVLREDAHLYFEMRVDSPYMLMTFPVLKDKRLAFDREGKDIMELVKEVRSDIPAVTHVDYSARVQTIDTKRHPFICQILSVLKEETGCSVAVNTSFNVRGEPIVNSAQDAYQCFMATDMDYVVIGNRLFDKTKQRQTNAGSEGQRIRRRVLKND